MLVSAVITAAFRKGQIIAKVSTPDTTEQAEALAMLNPIILSSVGFEAGEDLADLNIGGTYDQSAYCSTYVPMNARLVLNQTAARTLKLDPQPYEGQRLAIADASGNLATYNLILDGNGRKIESSATLTLSTNSDSRQWLYRADTANWVKITALVAADSAVPAGVRSIFHQPPCYGAEPAERRDHGSRSRRVDAEERGEAQGEVSQAPPAAGHAIGAARLQPGRLRALG
jgi:hypothetical protein